MPRHYPYCGRKATYPQHNMIADQSSPLFTNASRQIHGQHVQHGQEGGHRGSGKRAGPMTGSEQPDIILDPQQATKVRRPPMYKVVIYNDDFTPMDFVVLILRQYFRMTLNEATGLMLSVHHNGAGVCGTYTFEVAETKRSVVILLAKQEQYPLRCCVERV